MSQKIKIIFTLSFLLNILLVGYIGGQEYKKHKKPDFKHSISRESQALLKSNMRSHKRAMQEDKRNLKSIKKELGEIVEADDFDKEKFTTQMNLLLEGKHNISKKKAVHIAQTLEQLPKADRAVIFKRMMHHLGGKKSGGKKRRPQKY